MPALYSEAKKDQKKKENIIRTRWIGRGGGLRAAGSTVSSPWAELVVLAMKNEDGDEATTIARLDPLSAL
ncbi:hypothetical protein E2C01_088025 [Portunus trituberculatus]|uniref:Uncharacterized protein n=1 Tax=Portunus trituberculatus TaxID=210409 RepID=A0A5B7JEV5_PORTR|nr:hypothetical protein [Portunus trituberculatus]